MLMSQLMMSFVHHLSNCSFPCLSSLIARGVNSIHSCRGLRGVGMLAVPDLCHLSVHCRFLVRCVLQFAFVLIEHCLEGL